MRKYIKKTAVVAMAGVLAVGTMTGCSKTVDGTKVVATINDEELKLGTVSFMTRYQQAQTVQMYEMYFGGSDMGIWDTVADEETGETYGDQTIDDIMEQMEEMVLLRQHGSEYGIEISGDEQAKITEAAKSFIEANDEATIQAIGTDQSCVEEALALSYYQEYMFDPMVADVDTEVSDEEAAQTGITYVEVSKLAATDSDSSSDSSSDSDSDSAEEAGTEETEQTDEEAAAQAQSQAQTILEQVLSTADADMDTIAQSVDEDLSATETHYNANPSEAAEEEAEETEDAQESDSDSDSDAEEDDGIPQEVKDVVSTLQDGEVASELIETDDAYYVVRLDAALDRDATDTEKETIVNDRQQEAYDALLKQWKDDANIDVDEGVLKTLTVRDNDKYSFKEVETEDSSADSGTVDSSLDSGAVDSSVDSGAVDSSVDSGAADSSAAEDAGATE